MQKQEKAKVLISIVVAMTMLLVFLFADGIIVFDHSGVRRGEGVYWNDVLYVPASGEYSEGKTIAKTNDGWQINEVEEDDTHTFIVLRSFLDQSLLVREDYEVPSSGEITTLYWNRKAIADEEFKQTVVEILAGAEANFEYVTDGIFQLKDNQHMRLLCAGYNGCPVATEYLGYMGTVDGSWYLTVGQPVSEGTVTCYAIPEEYVDILKRHFS